MTPNESPAALLRKALQRAFNYGQDYWALADSESYKANKKADAVRAKFDALVEETIAASTTPGASESRGSVPDGWLPIETVPKDGTFFDVWHINASGFERIADCKFYEGKICSFEPDDNTGGSWWPIDEGATHWRPIVGPVAAIATPTPPAVANGEPPDWAIAKRNALRRLVDAVWNAATDSQEVPSMPWSDELIDSVFGHELARSAAAKGEG